MEADLQRTLVKAGLKLGGGLLLVAAVVGIRIVTATPEGVEGQIAELEAAQAEWNSAPEESSAQEPGAPPTPAERSSASKANASGRGAKSSLESTHADRLVSCDLGGATQFMRAADCATRGGHSTNLKPRR